MRGKTSGLPDWEFDATTSDNLPVAVTDYDFVPDDPLAGWADPVSDTTSGGVGLPSMHKDTTQAGLQITRDNLHWRLTVGAAAGADYMIDLSVLPEAEPKFIEVDIGSSASRDRNSTIANQTSSSCRTIGTDRAGSGAILKGIDSE